MTYGPPEAQLSPQNKRSRDQFVEGQEQSLEPLAKEDDISPIAEEGEKSRPISIIQDKPDEEEPRTKRHRDSPPAESVDDNTKAPEKVCQFLRGSTNYNPNADHI